MTEPLQPESIRHLSGFGFSTSADSYVIRVSSQAELTTLYHLAKQRDRKLCFRAGGRSYGDANYLSEEIVVDFSPMNRITDWDPKTGLIETEPGVTIEQLWQKALPDGFWPPVVPGTMFTTVGGALAMNIHGKNHFKEGSLAEHVVELDILVADGKVLTLTPNDELFNIVIGSAGLLCAVTRIVLTMHPVKSGELKVVPIHCKNWQAQFQTFEDHGSDSDYLVGWVDCFAKGRQAGRGIIHKANYADATNDTLNLQSQSLPTRIAGIIPKSSAWKFLKPLNNRTGMRFLNAAKHFAGKLHTKPYNQSLVAFSFLLDYVPGWQKAYEPCGFIQFQPFVPRAKAPEVFQKLIEMQQEAKMENFLAVLKRHKPDPFLISYALDGYSLAMDFKVYPGRWKELESLCQKMTEIVLDAGGKFYWAKDSTLRPEDAERYLGGALAELKNYKQQLDPETLFTSALARRLRLFPGA